MKRLLTVLLMMALCACQSEEIKKVDTSKINTLSYELKEKFAFDVHSNGYLLVRLSDFEVLYGENEDLEIFPASLTKVATLDTVLNYAENLDDLSSVSSEQVYDLIAEDASLAYIMADHDYTIRDLLYALVLPSGADAAVALENYFEENGMDLVDKMNEHLQEIGCDKTHFVNTTGLHDDDHHTCLNDLLKIVLDVLRFEEGRKILECFEYELEDGNVVHSSLSLLSRGNVEALGGKTGFTDELGQSVMVFYRKDNRSYVLMLCNAMGSPYDGEYWHLEDALHVFYELYD